MLKEFKNFAMQGNMLDMAVGIIIGAGFSTVVNSLVNDVLMPVLGVILGDADFSNLFIVLQGGSYDTLAAAQEAGAVTLNYGLFINALVNFLIVAFALFLVIKSMNRLRKEEEGEAKEE